jgi:hypothetical protein
LQERINSTEEENKLLQNFNEVFGDENELLLKENESLRKEVARFKGIRVPAGRKRSKSCSRMLSFSEAEETDEQDAVKARVRFFLAEFCFYLMKILTVLLIYLDRDEKFIKRVNS